MPSDVTRIPSRDPGRTGALPVTPSVGAPKPGAALARIGAVRQSPDAPGAGGALGRSGLDLLDVLASPDVLVGRAKAGSVGLEVGLESARMALLRGLPVDALAALDAVWEGAMRTEDGWYVRSGALLVLGLPGESDRIAGAGLDFRPGSTALRFLQSLSRLTLGNLTGARTALELASQRLPSDPLLRVQHAIVTARQGDGAGADALLSAALKRIPADHPLAIYAIKSVRTATVELLRQQSTAPAESPGFGGVQRGAIVTSNAASATDGTGSAHAEVPAELSVIAGHFSLDPVVDAFCRFGTRLPGMSPDAMMRELRTMLGALSSGGTLSTITAPEVSHSARLVLSAILAAGYGDESEHDPGLQALVRDVVEALRAGNAESAQRALRRQHGVGREAVTTLLAALVRGALPPTDGLSRDEARFDGRTQLVEEEHRGPIVPVRLGLRLIDDTASTRASARTLLARTSGGQTALLDELVVRGAQTPWAGSAIVDGLDRGVAHDRAAFDVSRDNAMVRDGARGLHGAPPYDGDPIARQRWGTELMTARRTMPTGVTSVAGVESDAHDTWTLGRNARVAAMLCVVLAAGAAATGYTAVAVACGIGAAWLALRRIGAGRGGGGRRTGHDGRAERR